MNQVSQCIRTTSSEPAKPEPPLRARWLGKQLHEAREAAGLTLKDASAHLLRDTGTVSRFESGRLPPKPGDVGALLNLYGVTDPDRRAALDRLGRDVWAKAWWDSYAGRVAAGLADLAWVENRAYAIASYDSATIPDLLQTEDFARTVIRAADPDAPADHLRTEIEFHARRRRLLAATEPPELTAVLDETLLLKPIGGPPVMRAQLHHLRELAEHPNLTVRVLPLTAAELATTTGAFRLFTLPEPYTEVAYARTPAGPTFVESTGVTRFTAPYARILAAALSPEASAKLIEAAADALP